ncbi:MAG: DUF2087 domain-containing protein [Ilumatobacteraceae bacterium]
MTDALTLVGLLADPDRRRVFAALVLDAHTLSEIERATGLPAAVVATALGRFATAGLVEDLDGELHLLGEAFALAARAGHRARATDEPDVPDGFDDPASRKVFSAFVRDGRIVQVPSAAGKRQVLLEWLCQDFEPGRRYSEAMVNLILGRRHPDTAMWRRYLVDADLLSREQGVYWRSGGAVDI